MSGLIIIDEILVPFFVLIQPKLLQNPNEKKQHSFFCE